MKVFDVIVFTWMVLCARSFPYSSTFDLDGLDKQLLLPRGRRVKTGEQSPPDFVLKATAGTGKSRKPPKRARPSEPSSDVESDSLADGGPLRAKVKVKATGPAEVLWGSFGSRHASYTVIPGKKYTHSFRGNPVYGAEVETKRGGKAEVTVRGQKEVESTIATGPMAGGSITPVLPTKRTTIGVDPEDRKHVILHTQKDHRFPVKLSSKVNGAAKVSVQAVND